MSKLTELQISLSYKHFPESCVGTSARARAHTCMCTHNSCHSHHLVWKFQQPQFQTLCKFKTNSRLKLSDRAIRIRKS